MRPAPFSLLDPEFYHWAVTNIVKNTSGPLLLVILIFCGLAATDAFAQEPPSDPLLLGARHVLGDEFRSPGAEFIVDTLRSVSDATPHSPAMQSRLSRLAAALEARTGNGDGLFECAPPTVENFGRRCRRLTGVRQVLQLSEPKQSDGGLQISVSTTFFRDHPDNDHGSIGWTTREIKLLRGEAGVWRVVGEGLESNTFAR